MQARQAGWQMRPLELTKLVAYQHAAAVQRLLHGALVQPRALPESGGPSSRRRAAAPDYRKCPATVGKDRFALVKVAQDMINAAPNIVHSTVTPTRWIGEGRGAAFRDRAACRGRGSLQGRGRGLGAAREWLFVLSKGPLQSRSHCPPSLPLCPPAQA